MRLLYFLIFFTLTSGCMQSQAEYVCANGLRVYDPKDCPKPTTTVSVIKTTATSISKAIATSTTHKPTASTTVGTPTTTSLIQSNEISGFGNEMYDFRLGDHDIEGNSFEFTFPGSGSGPLYFFNLDDFNNIPDYEVRLLIELFDEEKKLIDSSDGICASSRNPSFGSIGLVRIYPSNVDEVRYYRMSFVKCEEESFGSLDESRPEVKFARKLEKAIRKGDSSILQYFHSGPSAEEKPMYLMMADMIKDMLDSGGGLYGVIPLDELDSRKYAGLCDNPHQVLFMEKDEAATRRMGLVICRFNGGWMIPNLK